MTPERMPAPPAHWPHAFIDAPTTVTALLYDACALLTRAAVTARTETERAEFQRMARRCTEVARLVAERATKHPR